MRAIAVIIVFACTLASASAANIEARAVRHGHDVIVSDRNGLAAKLIRLVESSSVNSTAWAVSDDTWAQIEASGSFVRIVFPEPRRVQLMSQPPHVWELQLVRELLLPLPEGRWPAHIFVKVANDTLAVTKYDPSVFKEVILQQELQLLTVEPYKSFISLGE